MANGVAGGLPGSNLDSMQNSNAETALGSNQAASNSAQPQVAVSPQSLSNEGQPPSAPPLEEPVLMMHELKKVLRDAINKVEARLAGLTGKKPGNYHAVWARELGEVPQGIASVSDLKKKLAWLNDQLDQAESSKVRKP